MMVGIFIESLAIGIISFSFCILYRASGVFLLELSILGTTVALTLFSFIHPNKNINDLSKLFLAFALVIYLFAFLASYLYRSSRASRGGEATSVIMSLALTNLLANLIDKLTGSRAVPISIFVSMRPYLPLLLALFVSAFLVMIPLNKHISGLLKLSRDNDSLLYTFELSGQKIRNIVVASIAIISSIGFVIYISVQTTFSMQNYMQILIPSFAIAISIDKANFLLLLMISFVVTYIGKFSTGSPILIKAYYSLSFIGILVAVIGTKQAILSFRLRRIYGKRKYTLLSN